MNRENSRRKNYLSYLKPYKFQYILQNLAYICVVAAQLIIPQLISELVSTIVNFNNDYFLKLCVAAAALIVLETAGIYVFGHYNFKLSNVLLFDILYDILQDVFRSRYEVISKQNTYYLAQLINNDINIITDFIIEKIPLLTFRAIKVIVIITILFSLNTFMGLFALLGAFVFIIFYMLTRRTYYRLGKRSADIHSEYFAFVTGKLSNILLIKINSWYSAIRREYKKLGERFVKISVKNLDFDNFTKNFSNFSGRLLVLALMVIINLLAANGGSSAVELVGIFTIAIFYVQDLMADMSYIVQCANFYQTYRVSRDRVEKVLDMPRDINGDKKLTGVESISLDNVSFSYDDNAIIHNFTHRFEKGRIYAVAGENGSGKSTLLMLVLGILRQSEGTVLWNDETVESLDMIDIRKHLVSFVNQEPYLIEGTIMENLIYGREDNKDILTGLAQSHFLDFVSEKPEGFDTRINNRSSNLSGGEKQRVAIMKAVLKDAYVMFFDEPTSALDSEGTEQFFELLGQLKNNRIIFIVSHDLSLLDLCYEKINMIG